MINIFKFLKNFSINLSGFEEVKESTDYSFKQDFSKKGCSIEERLCILYGYSWL